MQMKRRELIKLFYLFTLTTLFFGFQWIYFQTKVSKGNECESEVFRKPKSRPSESYSIGRTSVHYQSIHKFPGKFYERQETNINLQWKNTKIA